jgi:cobalt-zinc-cadmium efflux system protein
MTVQHHDHDDHAPGATAAEVSARRERRLRSVLVLNLVIVAGEAVAGIVASSIGLLADAAHNLVDVGGVALALVAVRWARRPPTSRRSFGFHRGTVLAAQANAALILGATLLVLWESARRLRDPEPVEGGVVLVVATIAFVANTGSALLLRDRGHDLNMRAALLHMVADAAASLGVAVGGLVILTTGRYDRIDPLVSIAIALLIGWQGWRLLRASGEVLLESTPAGVDLDELAATIRAVDGVDDVHDLHVWSLSSEVHALSAHVIVGGDPSLDEAQVVGTRVKATISGPFRIVHATLELESARCVDDGAWCTITGLDVAQSGHAGHSH